MADQVFTITPSVLLVDTAAEKRWQFSVRPTFHDVFVPEGVDERSLYRLILSTDTVFPILVRLLISESSSGQDLDEAWEMADEGLIFAQGGSSVTVPGPDHVDNDLSDANETYRWFPPPALGTDLLEWAFTTLDTAADFTVTFRTPAAAPNRLVTASVPGRAGGASLALGVKSAPLVKAIMASVPGRAGGASLALGVKSAPLVKAIMATAPGRAGGASLAASIKEPPVSPAIGTRATEQWRAPARLSADTDYVITLTVTDDDGASSSDTLAITVRAP